MLKSILQRAVPQFTKVEVLHVFQQRHECLGAMIERAGYPGIAADLDLDKIASVLPALKKRAFEMYEEGERLTGHKGLPLEFTPNLAAE